MSAVVYCIVVVGSCMAVVVVSVTKGIEDATPSGQHVRGRPGEGEGEPPDVAVAAPIPAIPVAAAAPAAAPAPVERIGRHARKSDPTAAFAVAPAAAGPRRRPSPAEMARRSRATHGIQKTPWWKRLRAAATLSVLAVLLGLATAGAVGLVAVLLYTVLRSAV